MTAEKRKILVEQGKRIKIRAQKTEVVESDINKVPSKTEKRKFHVEVHY